jgi:hypothetical protein
MASTAKPELWRTEVGDEVAVLNIPGALKRSRAFDIDVSLLVRVPEGPGTVDLIVRDNGYGQGTMLYKLPAGQESTVRVPVGASKGWYDVTLRTQVMGKFSKQFAGRLESGVWTTSDPAMAS